MRKQRILCSLLAALSLMCQAQVMDLAGRWRFAIDREDKGVAEQWYLRELEDEVTLPGSMLTNGKGDPVGLQTPWVGSMNDSTFFKAAHYAPYREADNFKVPFWLQPALYYAGVAWYQRDVDIPREWQGQSMHLVMERCHWASRVWVDGQEIGTQDALSAPHIYDLTSYLTPGKHTLSIRVDNAIRDIDPGENSHSISDHTQGNWNGIVGDIVLKVQGSVYYRQVDVYPQVDKGVTLVKAHICNIKDKRQWIQAAFRIGDGFPVQKRIQIEPGDNYVKVVLPLPADVKLWDEFHPHLYQLKCTLMRDKETIDEHQVTFGCRTWSVEEGELLLNGHPVYMRGTLHCAAFPLTGYPATDKEEWMREFRICKQYGINHIRFHSWCPPEAAFEAVDELGMYLMIECSSWANQSTTIGDSGPLDEFIHQEAEHIVNAFGNHPSFCMMAYGNEPAGKHHKEYLTNFVNYWKERDSRRLYTSAAGWPNLPANDFLSDSNPRIQQWGTGLKSIINAKEPSTAYDWRDYTGQFSQPIISHEIGQWCVYPNFKEMKKYTGAYKPRNFEIFQATLEANGMGQLADDFLYASGRLQTLCYKADIEAALRTPRFGGFQLLGLNDFPGQGTALVGTLDAFWEEKGYVTPEEYSRFCSPLVPLARIPHLVMDNDKPFDATVEVANYYQPIRYPKADWTIRDAHGKTLAQGTFDVPQLELGNGLPLGSVHFDTSLIREASQLKLVVNVEGYSNDWDFWVYPARKQELTGDVLLTDTLDQYAMNCLQAGGRVLLSIRKGHLRPDMGGDVSIGFSSIFWNTSWTNGQAPHTLGILCDPEHPALSDFPTESYSNYQWWDAMHYGSAIHLGKLDRPVQPLVRVIDDWFTNRPLALLFEVQVGKGKLLVSGIDFHQEMEHRPAARQLLHSLQRYMLSDAFEPSVVLTSEVLRDMIK